MNRTRVLQLSRRVILVVALAVLGYLYWRFEVIRLPESNCSPLLRFTPGSSLVVDKHPPTYDETDAVFFRSPGGGLFLGLIETERQAGFWIVADNPDCAGRASEEFGEIDPRALRGRVLFALSSR